MSVIHSASFKFAQLALQIMQEFCYSVSLTFER